MNNKKVQKSEPESSTHFKRNVLIASIPVIGTIIVALVTTPSLNCSVHGNEKEGNGNNIVNLRNDAGKINDHIVFSRYDDVMGKLVEGLKPYITRDILKSDRDSVNLVLGSYIKTIDTSYSRINNADVFFLKNQYERGINLVHVIFDNQGKVFGLYSTRHPRQ